MRAKRRNRLIAIIAIVAGVAVSAGFALYAFNQNLMFYFSPTEVMSGKAPGDKLFRLGGMVVDGSVQRPGKNVLVVFDLTDFQNKVTVKYEGILPDLFREGQGIIAKGKLNENGQFVAEEVLAKHDENYMPPEVAASLKKQGKTNP